MTGQGRIEERHHAPETPMSCEILRDLIEEGELTRAELADLLNLRVHSTYPYTESRELQYSHLRTLFRRGGCDELRRRFLADLTEGTAFTATFGGLPEDTDHDGDVDLDDLLQAAVLNSGATADLLVDAHTAFKIGRIDDTTVAQLDEAAAELDRLRRIAARVYAQQQDAPTRRRARPLLASNGVTG